MRLLCTVQHPYSQRFVSFSFFLSLSFSGSNTGLRFYAAVGDETTDLSTLFVEVLSDFGFVEGVVITPFKSLEEILVPNDEGVPEPFQTFYFPLEDFPDQEWAGVSVYDLFGLSSTMIFDEIRFVSATTVVVGEPPLSIETPPPAIDVPAPVDAPLPPPSGSSQPPAVEVSPSPPPSTTAPSPPPSTTSAPPSP